MNETGQIEVPVIYSEVTYLEMVQDPQVQPADLEQFSMRRVENMSVSDYMDIYREVGRDYLWNYRPGQSHEDIRAILSSPATWMYVLFEEGQAVGMAELDASNPDDVELIHFGLIPRFLNQGIGKLFLQNVISVVWRAGVRRMWLSTCGMDHPKAIRFYEAAGFIPFKTRMGEFKDWRFTGFYNMADAPQIPFGAKVPTGSPQKG
jgi:GNAT superfamily N-acetyltransferase